MASINLSRQRSLHTAVADRALETRQRTLAQLQEQLSTGRRVNRASDDPAAFGQARQMDALANRYAQYQRSIDAAQSWVDHTQDALSQLAERFAEIYERGLRATSYVVDGTDREAEAGRLESLIEGIVDLLNTKDGDEYVFAGARTTARPFEITGGVVGYNGNSAGRARQIGDDLRLDVNIPGDRVLDTGAGFTITESVQGLADAIRSGDTDQVQTALDRVIKARDHVIDLGGEAGGIANRLDLAGEQLREAVLRVEQRRSELEDVDVAAAVVAFQANQTSLQAALKVTASVLQTSLLNYLR